MTMQIGDGYIVIETPNFGGFHHQHLYFYSLPFYKNLAEKYGIKLVDYTVYEGGIIVVFSKSSPETDKVGETLAKLADRARLKQKSLREHIDKFRNFIKNHKEIYMWGTGSFSIILLSQLEESELKNKTIIPIDSDMKRVGYMLAAIPEPVRFSKEIKGSRPEALIITSSFSKEIRNVMRALDIVPCNILDFFAV
jgi:hypothetical protein